MDSAKTLGVCALRRLAASAAYLRATCELGARPTTVYALGLSLLLMASLACTQLQLTLRKPGERNKAFPEKVAKQYDCSKRPLPFVAIEESDVLPTKLNPGDELNHRLVYVMCPAKATDVVSGTLHTRILFEGQVIDQDNNTFKLKPGRWEIVNLFDVQPQALPGVYSFAIEFSEPPGKGSRQLQAESTFIVQAP